MSEIKSLETRLAQAAHDLDDAAVRYQTAQSFRSQQLPDRKITKRSLLRMGIVGATLVSAASVTGVVWMAGRTDITDAVVPPMAAPREVTAKQDPVPQDSFPQDSVPPQDSFPQDSFPQDSVPPQQEPPSPDGAQKGDSATKNVIEPSKGAPSKDLPSKNAPTNIPGSTKAERDTKDDGLPFAPGEIVQLGDFGVAEEIRFQPGTTSRLIEAGPGVKAGWFRARQDQVLRITSKTGSLAKRQVILRDRNAPDEVVFLIEGNSVFLSATSEYDLEIGAGDPVTFELSIL
jgi:hypothetical protein